MTPFAQVVQEWQTFYATIAASSATLVGLLFVALTLNPNTLTRAENNINRLLARQIFTSFVYLIGIGLTFIIPEQNPWGIGLPLLGVGILGLVRTFADLRAIYRNTNQDTEKQGALRRSALKAVASGMFILIAIVVLITADPSILWWMIAPILFLLLSASLDTWILLVAIQEASSNDSIK